MNRKIRLYTVQRNIVIQQLIKVGTSHVKREYIIKKYGLKVSKYILIGYDWFIQQMDKQISKPYQNNYPIWCFKDPRYAKKYGDGKCLILEVPEDSVLLFDNHGWERILNLSYIGDSKIDEQVYDQKIQRYGLSSGMDAFDTSFYPQIQREIKESWKRVFDVSADSVIRGALWQLKNDWVINQDIFKVK